jgi:hypothetical protein
MSALDEQRIPCAEGLANVNLVKKVKPHVFATAVMVAVHVLNHVHLRRLEGTTGKTCHALIRACVFRKETLCSVSARRAGLVRIVQFLVQLQSLAKFVAIVVCVCCQQKMKMVVRKQNVSAKMGLLDEAVRKFVQKETMEPCAVTMASAWHMVHLQFVAAPKAMLEPLAPKVALLMRMGLFATEMASVH